MCSQACALDAAAAPCLARPRVAPKLMLGRPAVLAAGCSPLPSSGTLGGTSWPAVGLRLDERHKTIRRVRWRAVRQHWADDELELPAPRSGGQRGPGPARTLHRCCIMRHATCGSHATCGTPGTRRGSVGYGRGILAARRTGQSSRTAQSRLTLHVLHWHGLHWRRSRGTSAGLTTTAALAAAALATTWWEGWLRHRTRSRSRARARRPTHASPRTKRRRVHKKKNRCPAQARNPYFSRRLGASDGDVASYEGPQIITVPLYPSFSPCGWPSPSQHGPSPQSQFWSLRAQSTLHSVSGAAPAGEVLARSVLAHRSSSSSSSSSSVSSSFSVDSQASPAPWALALC